MANCNFCSQITDPTREVRAETLVFCNEKCSNAWYNREVAKETEPLENFDARFLIRWQRKEFTMSSLEHPNVVEGKEIIPNAVRRDYLLEMLEEYAEVVPVHNPDHHTFEVPWEPGVIYRPMQEFLWRVMDIAEVAKETKALENTDARLLIRGLAILWDEFPNLKWNIASNGENIIVWNGSDEDGDCDQVKNRDDLEALGWSYDENVGGWSPKSPIYY